MVKICEKELKNMNIKEQLDALKAQFIEASTEAQKEAIFEQIRKLIDINAEAVAKAAVEQAREIVEAAKK